MGVWEAVAIAAAGLLAGGINTIVGSGTLITFPTLLFFGYPPVVANVSNSLGLVPGSVAGAWGYRRELRPVASLALRLVPFSALGAVAGALLLLWLPPEAFEAIVPPLIALALVLVVVGPRLYVWVSGSGAGEAVSPGRWLAMAVGVLLAGVYGGYFGAAQGVLVLGLLSLLTPWGIQSINGIKNVLSALVNLVAAVAFVIVDPTQISWPVVALVGLGATVGGLIGGRVGRSIPPWLLRAIIVVVGVVAIVAFVVDRV